MTLAHKARREKIVKALVRGEPHAKIAVDMGVSRQRMSQIVHDRGTQSLIQRMLQPHHRTLERLIPRALAAVNTSLKPSQETGDRLKGVRTLGYLMELAEGGAQKNGNGDNGAARFAGSMEELLLLYRKVITQPEA